MNLTFTKKGRTSTSGSITAGGSGCASVQLEFENDSKKVIVIQTRISSTMDWAPQASVNCASTAWNRNITGIAPMQQLRIVVVGSAPVNGVVEEY